MFSDREGSAGATRSYSGKGQRAPAARKRPTFDENEEQVPYQTNKTQDVGMCLMYLVLVTSRQVYAL